MKKGTKIITTVVAMCLVITAMVVGIWAATQQVGSIGATVTFKVEDVKIRALGWTTGNKDEDGAVNDAANEYYMFADADVEEPGEGAAATTLGEWTPALRFSSKHKDTPIVIYYVVQNLGLDKAIKFESTLVALVTAATPVNLDVGVEFGTLTRAITVEDREDFDTDNPDSDFLKADLQSAIDGATLANNWTKAQTLALTNDGMEIPSIAADGGYLALKITLNVTEWSRSFEDITMTLSGIFSLV